MKTAEVANRLVALCREGKFEEAIRELYAPGIVSVEGFAMPPMPRRIDGLEAVLGKARWWAENHEVHSSKVGSAYVSEEKFAVVFEIDVTFKPTGKRHAMAEVAIYTVSDGKIVHEEFLYAQA